MSKVRMKLQHAGNPTVYEIDILLHPEWAPLGAQRFLDLVDAKYFDGCPLYRFIPNFIVQWGVPLDPALWKQWGEKKIKDDPVTQSNKLARLSFATSGPSALRRLLKRVSLSSPVVHTPRALNRCELDSQTPAAARSSST